MLISLSCWGDWHLDIWRRFGLPSLMAKGNLPDTDCRLIIHTREQDAGSLGELPRTAEIDTDHVTAHLERGISPKMTQAAMWRRDYERAIRERCPVAFLWPDVVFSQGTLSRYKALLADNVAIYQHFPRVDYDAAKGRLGPTDSLELSRIFLDCEHHLSQAHRYDNDRFPDHCELVNWRVPNGYMARMTAATPTVLNPQPVPLTGQMLLGPLGKVAVIQDASESIGLSLCPRDKDRDWWGSRPVTSQRIREWLASYDSPVNEQLARTSYRLATASPVDWWEPEMQASSLMDGVFGRSRWQANHADYQFAKYRLSA